jgi:hypothetical protein
MNESIEDDRTLAAVYDPVSLTKFIVLSLLTGGIYELYWFYKTWRFVRDRDSSTIMPFWRALFSPFRCFPSQSHPQSDSSLARRLFQVRCDGHMIVSILRILASSKQDEQILYFYSEGFFSIKDDGNLLTDRGIMSYWRDEESNEFYIEKAAFSEIAKIAPEYGNFVEPTLVTITRYDESEFVLLLSTADRRDRLFLRKLEGFLDR